MLNSFFRLNGCPNIERAENDDWFYRVVTEPGPYSTNV